MGILPSPRSLERNESEGDVYRISPATFAKFSSMFDHVDSNATGYVTGAQGRVVLSQSGLPNGDLRRIWDLADAGKDGMLDRHEYVACQFLIQHRLAGKDLPDSLPAGLQEMPASPHFGSIGGSMRGLDLVSGQQANSRPPSPPSSAKMQRPPSPPQIMQQAHNKSVPTVLTTNMPTTSFGRFANGDGGAAAYETHGALSHFNTDSAIQLQDYSRFVQDFCKIDTDGDGYISGLEARGVLTQSELPTGELRRIWDLSDITSDGRLDEHEFAVAMILVRMRQQGAALPDVLPLHLRTRPDIFSAAASRIKQTPDVSSQSSAISVTPSMNSVNVAPHGYYLDAGREGGAQISPLLTASHMNQPESPTRSEEFEDATEDASEHLGIDTHTYTQASSHTAAQDEHKLTAAYEKFAPNFGLLDTDGDGFITGGEVSFPTPSLHLAILLFSLAKSYAVYQLDSYSTQ